MITRIVKMTFREDQVEEFRSIFDNSKALIRNMPGCTHLELLEEKTGTGVFFTYSSWNSESDLNRYRESELFATVWAKTKILFSQKPEAWTTEIKASL